MPRKKASQARRARSVPGGSERALISLFGACSCRRTGVHFAGTCANVHLLATVALHDPAAEPEIRADVPPAYDCPDRLACACGLRGRERAAGGAADLLP